MCFRIRHEKISEVLVLLSLFLLLTVLSFVFMIKEMQLLLVCTLVLMLAVIILFILEQTVRTVIEIADHAVTVRRLFGKKRIAVSDISDVQITHYTRRRKACPSGAADAHDDQSEKCKKACADGFRNDAYGRFTAQQQRDPSG